MGIGGGDMRVFGKLAAVCCTAVLLAACQTPSASIDDKPWIWRQEFGTKPETVTQAQVVEWEKQALAGDMRLKRQFARAYFGCVALKFTERCEAMRTRLELGARFLREIIDLEPPKNDKWERYDIGQFQSMYTHLRYSQAAPTYDPASEACKDTIKYAMRAIDNGETCISRELGTMSRLGYCMEKNDPRYKSYLNRETCPII